MTTEPLKPRVFEGEAPCERAAAPPTPQVIMTERTDRIVADAAAAGALPAIAAAARAAWCLRARRRSASPSPAG